MAYSVKSYFINVGTGDSSVHLLLDGAGGVESAVLIDGGKSAAQQVVQGAIHHIRQMSYPNFLFTTIVVSHWDDDHYAGLLALLYNDWIFNNGASSYIAPGATFYCPLRAADREMADEKYRVHSNIDGPDDSLEFLSPTQQWIKVCKAMTGTFCLGHDLFARKHIEIGDNDRNTTQRTWPCTLLNVYTQSQTLLAGQKPIFFVYGIDNTSYGAPGDWDIPNQAIRTSDQYKNESSIMALIMWPRTVHTPHIRISLFTGGDAPQAQEQIMLDWIEGPNPDQKNNVTISAVKASHHGSHHSTPEGIFLHRLQLYIISAGRHYGHPSLAVVYCFLAIAELLNLRTGTDIPRPTMACLNEPYWLVNEPDKLRNIDFNPFTVMSWGTTARAIQERLESIGWAKADGGFLESYLLAYYGTAMKLAKTYLSIRYPHAQIKSWEDKYYTHPMTLSPRLRWSKQELNPRELEELRDEVFYVLIERIQQQMQVYWPNFCKPDLGNHPKVQYIEMTATADEEVIDHRVEVHYTPVAVNIVQDAGIWAEVDAESVGDQEIAWESIATTSTEEEEMRAELVTRATNPLFNPRSSRETSQPAGARPYHRDPFSPRPPVGSSIEGRITSTLVRGLLDSRPELTYEFNETLSATESRCSEWFGHCLQGAVSLNLVGAMGNERDISLSRAEIRLVIPDKGVPDAQQQPSLGGGNDTQHPIMLFSTDRGTRELQFDLHKEVGQQQTALGYDANVQGILFALDVKLSTSTLNLEQFSRLVGFSHPPHGVMASLLSLIALKPLEHSRSGLWFIPHFNYRTVIRLAMGVSEGMDLLKGKLEKSLGSLRITDAVFIGTQVTETLGPKHSKSLKKLSLQAMVNWTDKDKGPPQFKGVVAINFTNQGLEVVIKYSNSSNLLSSLLTWAKSVMPDVPGSFEVRGEQLNASDIEEQLRHVNGETEISVHRVAICLDHNMKPCSFEIALEISRPVTVRGQSKQVPFLATLHWGNSVFSLSAELWRPGYYGSLHKDLHPFHEDTLITAPSTGREVYEIPLADLLHLSYMPSFLPDTISDARFTIGRRSERTFAALSATIECKSSSETMSNEAHPPLLRLQTASLSVALDFIPGKTAADIALYASVVLTPPPVLDDNNLSGSVHDHIKINFKVVYKRYDDQKSLWAASASVEDLKVANLCDLFARDGSGDAILDLMAGIHIVRADISYQYHSNGATSLAIKGKLRFGLESESGVELELGYSHNGDKWSFTAKLRPATTDGAFRVVEFLQDLVEDESELPELVRNLKVPRNKLSALLTCTQVTDENSNKFVVFSLNIMVGDLNITLVQLRSVTAAKARSLARENGNFTDAAGDVGPARLLRVSLTKFPDLPHMPVIGAVEQPFDQLGIVWANRNVTAAEIAILNKSVLEELPLLSRTNKTGLEPLLEGFHFQVSMFEAGKPKLVLDHVAKKKKKEKKKLMGDATSTAQEGDGGEPISESGKSGKTVAPMAKTAGPLSITNIGLSVSGSSYSTISISLDATIQLGPVGFALMGFAFTVDLASVTSLEGLSKLPFRVDVKGMAVAFEKPPTRMAGLILKFDNLDEAGFMGAIAISFKTWSAIASGMYSEGKPPNQNKSMFVIGAVRGPIFTLGSVEVNGLTGGFGYNSRLTLPAVSQVAEFPFIAMNNSIAPPESLANTLSTLKGSNSDSRAWITMTRDDMWMVAGVGLRAFQMIDAQVLIALTLSEQPKFAVLAQATAIFPKSAPSQDALNKAFLFLDIVLYAEVDPLHGTIFASGELTPRSFILNPSCRLTGGFAFQLFLPGSPHEGDYAFTVGGYNPQYSPPSHYPMPPPRVAISWQYDSQTRILGAAYFAVTPQIAMGGGRLDLSVNRGWIRVIFSAWADFFMHFHPYSFNIDVGVTFSAELNLKVAFWNVHLGPYEFSARLGLYGPPLAGYAHLHFWRWDTVVVFGPAASPPQPLSWESFVRMVKNLPAESQDRSEDRTPNHIITITKGAVPAEKNHQPANQSNDSVSIDIRGTHLEFEVQVRVPVLKATFIGETSPKEYQSPLFARPMQHEKPISESHLTVELKGPKGSVPLQSQQASVKNVAPALWGRYDRAPASATNATEPMLQHVMGFNVIVSPKLRSSDNLPVIDMVKFNSVDIGKEGNMKIPVVATAGGSDKIIKGEGSDAGYRGHAHFLDVSALGAKNGSQRSKTRSVMKVWQAYRLRSEKQGLTTQSQWPSWAGDITFSSVSSTAFSSCKSAFYSRRQRVNGSRSLRSLRAFLTGWPDKRCWCRTELGANFSKRPLIETSRRQVKGPKRSCAAATARPTSDEILPGQGVHFGSPSPNP
ncbi:hypothetical protein AUP68_02688 [Ilyonectria robusta]